MPDSKYYGADAIPVEPVTGGLHRHKPTDTQYEALSNTMYEEVAYSDPAIADDQHADESDATTEMIRLSEPANGPDTRNESDPIEDSSNGPYFDEDPRQQLGDLRASAGPRRRARSG